MTFPPEANRPPASVPLEDVGLLVVESLHVTLTSHLLSKLAEYGIAWLGCGPNHMPNSLGLPLEGNSITGKRTRIQWEAYEPLKKSVWQQLVRQKIINQAAVLSRHNQPASALRLLRLSKEVKSGDPENCEGVAAAAYWPALFGSGFVRMRGGDEWNTPLNYGYAVLRAAVGRAIVASGMLPVMGVHHKNQYNAFALADDLMEPFRPYMDDLVYRMDPAIYSPEFSTAGKRACLELLTLDVRIDGKTSPLWNAIQTSTNSLVSVYQGTTRKLQLPDFLG